MKAVTLILKHATLLRTSNLPKAALTNVDLDYQRANIDGHIQQYLTTCASDLSVEQFASFIMGTEIGLFILLPSVTPKSYHHFSVILVLSHYRCIDNSIKQLLQLNPIKSRFNVSIFELCIIQVPMVKILTSVDPLQLSVFKGYSDQHCWGLTSPWASLCL